MRPAFLYWMAGSLLIGIAGAALLRRVDGPSRSDRLIAIALAGVTLALLCVGVVSHTLIRHIVQVTPPVCAHHPESSAGMGSRIAISTVFSCLQAGALVLSMQPWAIFT